MKNVAQIIKLAAIALAAMGLSFMLISGIIIGIETSSSPERKSLNIVYTEQTRQLNEIHDALIETANKALIAAQAKPVEGAYTQTQKDTDVATAQTNLTKAEKNKADAVRILNNANSQNGIVVTKGGKLQTTAVNATTGAVTVTAATADTLGWRARVSSAFTESTGTFSMDGGVTSTSYSYKLTPMGALMVAGLVFAFVGGALILGVGSMNKKEGEAKAAPAKKSTK